MTKYIFVRIETFSDHVSFDLLTITAIRTTMALNRPEHPFLKLFHI